MNHEIKLSVLFLKEHGAWVGQCLEHDIAAQGKTIEEAKTSLTHTLAAQLILDSTNNQKPLAAIKPAPEYYRTKFERAEKLKDKLEVKDDVYDAKLDDLRVALG